MRFIFYRLPENCARVWARVCIQGPGAGKVQPNFARASHRVRGEADTFPASFQSYLSSHRYSSKPPHQSQRASRQQEPSAQHAEDAPHIRPHLAPLTLHSFPAPFSLHQEPVYGAYSSWPLLSGGIRQFSSISRGSSSLTSRHSSESCADQ
ncbi:g11889 [Coccomyxa viridis]|uniref:G11889 protein n=1 Tax=Coccomyxa viridis TaxID=1274662 RepID=A0ABP1GDD1_9CHLO